MITWLIKLLSKLRFPFFKRPNLKSKAYHNICYKAQVGDILLTTSRAFFLNTFNPSRDYKHAGIITRVEKHSNTIWITEATSRGVVLTELFDFFEDKTDIALLRYDTPDLLDEVAARAESKLGLKYDYNFESDNKKYYCFELIVEAFKYFPNFLIEKVTPEWIFPLSMFNIFKGKRYLAESFTENPRFKLIYKRSVDV